MPLKLGWCHSSIDQAIKLAKAAKIKVLILYSHAPERTDKELDKFMNEKQIDFIDETKIPGFSPLAS